MTMHPSPDQFDPTAGVHPRCVEMAEFMREHPGCQFRDLRRADFTCQEITAFAEEAMSLAAKLYHKQIAPRGDLLADMKLKAREAVQNFQPLPRGTADSQALYVAWGAYCAARAAFALDPAGNDAQRERCIARLEAYFRLTAAGPAVAREIVGEVEDLLAGRAIHRAGQVAA